MWADITLSVLALILLFILLIIRGRRTGKKITPEPSIKKSSSFGLLSFLIILGGAVWSFHKYTNAKQYYTEQNSLLSSSSSSEDPFLENGKFTIKNNICEILRMNITEQVALAKSHNPYKSDEKDNKTRTYEFHNSNSELYATLKLYVEQPGYWWTVKDLVEYEKIFEPFASQKIEVYEDGTTTYKLSDSCYLLKMGYDNYEDGFLTIITATN